MLTISAADRNGHITSVRLRKSVNVLIQTIEAPEEAHRSRIVVQKLDHWASRPVIPRSSVCQ